MENQITKRQHYISVSHQLAWANSENKILVQRDKTKKPFYTSPTNIFVEKYFYELKPISKLEKNIILSMIAQPYREELICNCNEFDTYNKENVIQMYNIIQTKSYPDPFLRFLDKLIFFSFYMNNLQQDHPNKFIKELKQTGEDYHTWIENLGAPFLNKVRTCQVDKITSIECERFILYISTQSIRILDIKKEVFNSSSSNISEISIENIWPIFHIVLGMNVHISMQIHGSEITILTNKSNLGFITGSVLIDSKFFTNEQINTDKQLLWIFPISPKKAIRIFVDCKKTRVNRTQLLTEDITDENKISIINNHIYHSSSIIIYPPDYVWHLVDRS